MIFLFEAVPESIVRRYFLQVPALLNSLVSGFTVRVANTVSALDSIEVLFVKVHVFVLLLFASLPDCSQNQTAVSDTLRLLSDF